jgi:hypothetical protein
VLKAYSLLQLLLDKRRLTVPDLVRRLKNRRVAISARSLSRLLDANQPVSRLDMRVAGAICQVCQAPLSELIVFAPEPPLQRISDAKQRRLDVLMEKNNNGQLTPRELKELEVLVSDVEALSLRNTQTLASLFGLPAKTGS